MRNEDPALRLNSVKRLRTIARALGEERTRRELIPFLNDNCDDEDEVLLAMAEELGEFVPLVGGPSHAHILLMPLEALATVDETVVREKAAQSLVSVAEAMPPASLAEHFVPVVQASSGLLFFICGVVDLCTRVGHEDGYGVLRVGVETEEGGWWVWGGGVGEACDLTGHSSCVYGIVPTIDSSICLSIYIYICTQIF